MLLGLDQLVRGSALAKELSSRRVALLAHPASVDRRFRHISEILAGLEIEPRIIFGPEHGYGGEAQDMIGVADAKDARGVPVVSLYGETFDALTPTDAHLEGIDVLLIDLADIGTRFYTFIWTAVLAARKAFERGVEVVLLDRPNPLDGRTAEGRLQDPAFLSFVGLRRVPVRHGLTIGEIVALFTSDLDAPLRIVAVRGWERARHATGWDRPFVLTSPNMPTYDTALVYPGGCLLEGTNLSEGRGTTRPFEVVGAPFLDGPGLAEELAAVGLPGFVARPVTFLPTFQKHARTLCGGVQIHVTDPQAFRPYATYLALVALAKRQAPTAFAWRTEKYEFVDDIPAFDLLTGSAEERTAIDDGVDVRELVHRASLVDASWAETARNAQELAARATTRSGKSPS